MFLECESLSEGSRFAGLSRFENRTSKLVHSRGSVKSDFNACVIESG
jgi:hypothetical protein